MTRTAGRPSRIEPRQNTVAVDANATSARIVIDRATRVATTTRRRRANHSQVRVAHPTE
jgi:hypothetical protein